MQRALATVFALISALFGVHTHVKPPESVFFGLGTLFDGTDVAVLRWGNTAAISFDARCTVLYSAPDRVLARALVQLPLGCAPPCFASGVALEVHAGVMHISPVTPDCEVEAARVRVARWVNETTAGFISDTDIMYFETFAS
jgi:hypothetical protein